jgi:hypothetical protein
MCCIHLLNSPALVATGADCEDTIVLDDPSA